MTDQTFKFNGSYGKGVMREVRETKRAEAEERNLRTRRDNRRSSARRLGHSRWSDASEKVRRNRVHLLAELDQGRRKRA